MNGRELQQLIHDAAAAIKEARAALTPGVLATAENMAAQVKSRPLVQQALRLALSESTEQIKNSADSAAKLVALYREANRSGLTERLVTLLEKLEQQTMLLSAVAQLM